MVRGLEKSHVLHQALWNININIPYTPYPPYNPLHTPYTPPLFYLPPPKKLQKNLVE